MTVYYNEIDPFAAGWLRQLIAEDLIAYGEVDERSIENVKPSDLNCYKQCHFFAGIGVWSYALRQARWPDDRPVWTGSCPCQPFSAAGKRKGFVDERHLWPAWFHLIEQCKPDIVFGEQVASKNGLAWLDVVQADLEATNYTSAAVDLCAAGVGAPHIRQRLWFVAYADCQRLQKRLQGRYELSESCSAISDLVDVSSDRCSGRVEATSPNQINGFCESADWIGCQDGKFRAVEPGTFPLVDGAAARVGRLRGYGNAINAEVAKVFIEACM